MTDTNNTALSYGKEAANALLSGNSQHARGEQLAILAIATAMQNGDEYIYTEGKGDTAKRYPFTLSHYRAALAADDKKKSGAMKTALLSTLFSVDKDSKAFASVASVFSRVFGIASYLVIAKVPFSAAKVPVTVNGKDTTATGLAVPFSLLMSEPSDKATAGELRQWIKNKDKVTPLDTRSKSGFTVTGLRAKADDWREKTGAKKARAPQAGKGVSVTDAIEAAIKVVNDVSGKPAELIAIGAARRSNLKTMASKLLAAIAKEEASEKSAMENKEKAA